MVTKTSKMTHLFVFAADENKKSVRLWGNISGHQKDLIEYFQKMVWLIGFEVTIREILKIKM